MEVFENISLAPKTTMRIGGSARYFAELKTKEDVETAWKFRTEKNLPLVILGAGSNTVFPDEGVEALVVHINNNSSENNGDKIRVGSGKFLATFISEMAGQGLDLSALAGIPGTVGGAVFGNAGQGPKGIWIDSFLTGVEVFQDGKWKTFLKFECGFGYRESRFKILPETIIWEAVFSPPKREPREIEKEIKKLLNHRKETQLFGRTAGSCFKGLSDGTPAWKLIDAAGLRGYKSGGVQISKKHANFLLNFEGKGTYEDAVSIVDKVRTSVPGLKEVEMRFFEKNGKVRY